MSVRSESVGSKAGVSTRQRLLRVGLAAFFEKGYHASGVQHIVDAAEMPKGSFYNHFKSKEDLAIQSIESYSAAIHGELADRFRTVDGASALEALDGALEELILLQEGLAARRGCLLANLGGEVATTSPPLRDALRAGYESWRGPLAELFGRGQTEGSIRSDLPAAELADFFLDVWEGALLRMRIEGGSTRPLQERRRHLVTQFLPVAAPGPRP